MKTVMPLFCLGLSALPLAGKHSLKSEIKLPSVVGEAEVVKAKDEKVNVQAELKINVTNWSKDNISKLLKILVAVDVCAEFSFSMKKELNPMQGAMDQLIDAFESIRKKSLSTNIPLDVKHDIEILDQSIELLESYYKDCYDELSMQKADGSTFSACINHLKEFRNSAEKFNNSIARTIERITKLKSIDDTLPVYQGLKPMRQELKTMLTASESLDRAIDNIIAESKNILEIYHQYAYEERNHDLQKSMRAL